jgi:hypothetical protein
MLPLQIGPCPAQADLAAATLAGASNGELSLSRWLLYFFLIENEDSCVATFAKGHYRGGDFVLGEMSDTIGTVAVQSYHERQDVLWKAISVEFRVRRCY